MINTGTGQQKTIHRQNYAGNGNSGRNNSKPAEVRMGKGKGNPEGFVAPVTPGRIIFEADGVPYAVAKEALRLAAQKLPITTKFVVRRDYTEE